MAKPQVDLIPKMVVNLDELRCVKILHVDDELDFLKVSKKLLEMRSNFTIEMAVSVEEALKKINRQQFDVVISDYLMHGKDGLEFLQELRESGNNIPFILFTGRGREEVAIQALNLGADQYINKTGEPGTVYGELAYSITKAVENRRAEDKIRESEERYRRLFEEAPDGIVTLDLKGTVTSCNEATLKLTGFSRDEIVGKHFTKLGFLRLREIPKYLRLFTSIAKGKMPKPLEVRWQRKDGTTCFSEFHVSLIKADGKAVGIQAIARDVTERKKTQEALRESEEKYRTVVEQSLQGIVVFQDFRVRFANRALAKICGYSVKELLSLPPEKVKGLIHPDDQDLVWNRYKERLAGKAVPRQYRLRAIRKDGEICWLEAYMTIINYVGRPAIYGAIIDISEQMRVEKLYRNIVELSPEGIVTLDTKGFIMSCNTAAANILGYTRDELMGKHFSKVGVLGLKELPKYLRLFSDVLRGRVRKPLELIFHRKDGTPILCEVHLGLLKSGDKIIGVQAVSRDITKRKVAERELSTSQAKFQRLFMGNPEAAVYVNKDFQILEVNPRFSELFGYSQHEVRGKTVNEMIVPENKLEEARMLDKKTRRGYIYFNSVRKRKDGTKIPVAISAAPIFLNKKVIGHVALYRDISKLKKTEKDLRNTLEKLRVIGSLTRHDVRNKLSTITGNIYLAKEMIGSHKALDNLGDAESAVRQISKIFDFAGTYEKLGVEELTFVDLGNQFKEASSLFSDLQGVKTSNQCTGLKVLADSLLRQLFHNLIENSLKHGKRVTKVKIHFEKMGDDGIRLFYEDDGVGILSKEKKIIFKEGYGRGTGYGLYLVKKICEVYGWTIHESGRPGIGVCFTIDIPKRNEDGRRNYFK